MKINNEELSELYEAESDKLLLGLSSSRFNQYVEIINSTKSYRGVIDSIPPDLSNLEKAYYIYNKLGILLYENNSLVYNHIENLGMYYSTIRHNGIGNCRQMSELYVTMLTMSNVIERFYLTRKPVGVEGLDLRHIDAIIQVDGKLYMTDIIRDTVNMRAGIKNMKFGYIDTAEKRIHELIKFINANMTIKSNQKNRLIELIKQKKFEEFIRYFGKLEKEYATDFGLEFLKRKLPKIEFASQIKEQIGELTEVPREDDSVALSKNCKINNLRYESFCEIIENIGNTFVRISSNSPYIYIVTNELKKIKEKCREFGIYIKEYEIANKGIEIIERI